MILACPNCATTYEVKASVIADSGRSLRCARCHIVWFATRSQELAIGTERTAAAATTETPASAPAPAAAPRNADIAPPGPPFEWTADEQTTSPSSEEIPPNFESPPLAPVASHADQPPGRTTFNVEGEDIETFARRHTLAAPQRKQGVRDQFGAPAIIAILGVVVAALLAWRVTIVQHAPQMASFYASIGLPVNLRQLVLSDVRTSKETRDGVPLLLVEGTITSTSKFSLEVPRLRFSLRNRAGQEIYSWTAQPEQPVLAPGTSIPFRSRLASPPNDGHDIVVRFFNKRDATEGAH